MQAQGYQIGYHATRTLMRKAGVECKQRQRRYQVTPKAQCMQRIAPNLLNREFRVAIPNRVWVVDITYLWTLEGWLYVAAVLDLFSRRIVGWSIASHMRETLVQAVLTMALGRRQPAPWIAASFRPRCAQYASMGYQAELKAAGITLSMSRRGNCWDNAVMERFWGSLKSERTDGKLYISRALATADVIDYIEMFYNSKRLHSTLGYISPIQFENQYLLKNVSTFT